VEPRDEGKRVTLAGRLFVWLDRMHPAAFLGALIVSAIAWHATDALLRRRTLIAHSRRDMN
jgi:hypothetical protein